MEIDPDPTFTVDYLDTFYRRLSRLFKYHLRPPYKFDPKQCEKYAASTSISDVPIRNNRAYELNSRIRWGRNLICIYIKSKNCIYIKSKEKQEPHPLNRQDPQLFRNNKQRRKIYAENMIDSMFRPIFCWDENVIKLI